MVTKRILLSLIFALFFSLTLVYPQTVQELLQKARQSGLTDQQIKQQAEAMGYNISDYLKLQQSQQKQQNEYLNQLRVRSGIDTSVIMPDTLKETAKIDSNKLVREFSQRGYPWSELPAFGYNIFNYYPTTFQPSAGLCVTVPSLLMGPHLTILTAPGQFLFTVRT